MSILITQEEHAAVVSAVAGRGRAAEFFSALADRALRAASRPGIVQSDDTMEWRHIVWERLSDAAFTVRFAEAAVAAGRTTTELETLTTWLHDTTIEITRYDRDEWIGPWFRARKDPPEGQLETAHVGLGVATALDLCPDLFSASETEEIREALRDKCQVLCRAWLDTRLADRTHINNWFMVLLSGYSIASAMLGDTDAIRRAAEDARIAATVYNTDSYGESLQYWNYATIHLAHIIDVIARYAGANGSAVTVDPAIENSYLACLPWIDVSILGLHDVPGWGSGYAESINFGDSSHMFRPSGDVLLQIASPPARDAADADAGTADAGTGPSLRGIARRLFETLYADPKLEPVDRQTFGFFNTFGYRSVVYLALDRLVEPAPVAPAEHRFFESGVAVLRPTSEHADSALAFHGAHAELMATSHRHEDLLSFQLFFRGERVFTDPGHCCYRLATQRFSKSTAAHSTLSFETESGRIVGQNTVTGNAFVPAPPIARTTRRRDLPGGGIIVGCDAAPAYGKPVSRAERIFVYPDEHSLFIVDLVEAAEPVTVTARFVVNNRDNRMTYNHPAWDRTVIRRNDAAAKLFHLSAASRAGTEFRSHDARFELSWGYQHDVYHPQPNQHGQGREGSTVVFSYATVGAAKTYRLVHGIAMDDLGHIRSWHFRTHDDGTLVIEPPAGKGGWALKLDDLGMHVSNLSDGTHVTEAL
ncbi:MAG: hypothetical protein EA426_18895 [Spirochaetaceae bacterium]|nr:MAG: hypothetical protein EA426_18895 [Spirochaetaceae bacterium]